MFVIHLIDIVNVITALDPDHLTSDLTSMLLELVRVKDEEEVKKLQV